MKKVSLALINWLYWGIGFLSWLSSHLSINYLSWDTGPALANSGLNPTIDLIINTKNYSQQDSNNFQVTAVNLHEIIKVDDELSIQAFYAGGSIIRGVSRIKDFLWA